VPLGLVAYGIPTFLVGWVLAGRLPAAALQASALMPLILIMGGIVLFIAGLWAYHTTQVLAATFFCIFGGLGGTIAVFEAGAGPVVRTAIRLGLFAQEMTVIAVVTGCFTFVALFIAVAGLSAGSAASGASLADSGVGITSLALAVALFFITWSLFATNNMLLTEISGWASVVSGGLSLLSAAAVTLAQIFHEACPPDSGWVPTADFIASVD
jgi:succinate-acetate transporter protein